MTNDFLKQRRISNIHFRIVQPEFIGLVLTRSDVEIKDAGLRFKGHPETEAHKAVVVLCRIIFKLAAAEIRKPEEIRVARDQVTVFQCAHGISACINTLFVKAAQQFVSAKQKHFVVINSGTLIKACVYAKFEHGIFS